MKTFSTSKARICAVKLPKGVYYTECNHKSENRLMYGVMDENEKPSEIVIDLPQGNWQPLGFASEISESDKERVVEFSGVFYKNYAPRLDNSYGFYHASDSFQSLLSANEVGSEWYLVYEPV